MANLTLKRFLPYLPNKFLRLTPQISTIICQKQHLLISTDSKSSSSLSSSFTVKFLMNSFGLSLQDALLASKKFQLDEFKSHIHESVLYLLRSFQFTDTHIKKLIIKCPHILQSKVHNNLKPKLEYLRDNGFVGPLLPDLVVSNPVVFLRSLNDCIIPVFEFLKKYVRTNDRVVTAVKRTSWLWTFDLKGTMAPNIDFLLSQGVTTTCIERLIVWQPRTLMQKLDRIVIAVGTVKELGLDPSSPMCVQAIRVLLSMNDSTWKGKVQNFKSLGWSEEEIWSAFKRDSTCLAYSEEKVRRAMDFYVNTMKLNPGVIAVHPKLLSYSLNTRIRPRYNVIKVLESRKLLKKDMKHFWIFALSEKDFLRKHVVKHLDQLPNLMELYRGAVIDDKIDFQL